MKKNHIFCVLALVPLMCCCAKQGPAAFQGYYSFKTGGALDITGKVYDIRKDTVKTDTTVREVTIAGYTLRDTVYDYTVIRDTLDARDTVFMRYLVAESGQMHILRDGDGMVLTMNITGGDPFVTTAAAEGDRMVLSPAKRSVSVRPWGGDGHADADVRSLNFYWTLSGSGRRLENMVLMDLEFEGEYSYDGFDGVISSSNVQCIATENE